jgi:hypothetical protein
MKNAGLQLVISTRKGVWVVKSEEIFIQEEQQSFKVKEQGTGHIHHPKYVVIPSRVLLHVIFFVALGGRGALMA